MKKAANLEEIDYLIYGAGAIGSVLGGFLSASGQRVAFWGRGAHFKAIITNGLFIDGIWGEKRLPPVKPLRITPGLSVRNILLSVKAHQTKQAVKEIKPLAGSETVVFSMQNGLGNIEWISESLGEEHAGGGRVIFGATVVRPGHARVTVCADRVLVGFPGGKTVSPRAAEVADALSRAGIAASPVEDIIPHLWAKALYNCSLNPLGAILGVQYGRLGEEESTRKFISAVIDEIYKVADAHHVTLDPDSPSGYYALLMKRLLPPTASHLSSMFQDLEAGRKTEIDSLCGRITALGKEAGIPVPYNQTLVWMIRFLEKRGGGDKGRSI